MACGGGIHYPAPAGYPNETPPSWVEVHTGGWEKAVCWRETNINKHKLAEMSSSSDEAEAISAFLLAYQKLTKEETLVDTFLAEKKRKECARLVCFFTSRPRKPPGGWCRVVSSAATSHG